MDSLTNFNVEASTIISSITNGLQSNNLGSKCEAIAEFANFVKKYPYPMLISPMFSRLMDAFKDGPNSLRLIVMKSSEMCQEHLAKLSCGDEAILSLSHVMSSNDPCARAICLKLIALLHFIYRADKSIHHIIMTALESQYESELDAAIDASESYAPVSREFCESVTPVLCKQLSSLTTELTIKRRLIATARHLHHSQHTLERTWVCLSELLRGHRSLEMVKALLGTMTGLAGQSSRYAVNLSGNLLTLLQQETRPVALSTILDSALVLARTNPAAWSLDKVDLLCQYFCKPDDEAATSNCQLASKVIQFLALLIDNYPELFLYDKEVGPQDTVKLTVQCATSGGLALSAGGDCSKLNRCGLSFLCRLAQVNSDPQIAQHVINVFQGKVSEAWRCNQSASGTANICGVNESLLQLMARFPVLGAGLTEQQVAVFSTELMEGRHCSDSGFVLLCRLLRRAFAQHRDQLARLPRPHDVVQQAQLHRRLPTQVLVIAEIVLQLAAIEGGLPLSLDDSRAFLTWTETAATNGSSVDQWLVYRMARQASRYGQHGVAANLYERLQDSVSSLAHLYWLRALLAVSKAEATLLTVTQPTRGALLVEAVTAAQQLLQRARTAFKCSGSQLWFADTYAKIRVDLLSGIYTLIVTLNQYGLKSPSRNTSFAILAESRGLFETAATGVEALLSQCLDADEETIDQLQCMQQTASLFAQTIEAVVSGYAVAIELKLPNRSTPQVQWTRQLGEEASRGLATGSGIELLATLATNTLRQCMPLPRYLFQKLQTTTIRLTAVLAGKTLGQDGKAPTEVLLRNDQGHYINVFGVIEQHCSLSSLIRRVARLKVSVYLSSCAKTITGHQQQQQVLMEKVVCLNKDYFRHDFLLDLKSQAAGKYSLRVEANPIDKDGRLWHSRVVSTCLLTLEAWGVTATATVAATSLSVHSAGAQRHPQIAHR